MSGIYIPNMEMPSSCGECLNIGWNYVFECDLDDVESGARRADCPLVSVPDHGRLIDADETEKLFRTMGAEVWTDAADIVEEAATIIPADKEGN